MRPDPFTVSLEIPFEDRWTTLEEVNITPQRLWDYYLSEALESEVLAAAILVVVNGIPWNTVEHSESFYHIETWLSATVAILDGATHSGIFAWGRIWNGNSPRRRRSDLRGTDAS
jgi:hypothetical protein